MADEMQIIMAQIEANADLDILHPRALLMVDGLIARYGGEAVAVALTWLYAAARYDLRVARERADLPLHVLDATGEVRLAQEDEGAIDYPVADARFRGPAWLSVVAAILGVAGVALLAWAWP